MIDKLREYVDVLLRTHRKLNKRWKSKRKFCKILLTDITIY